MCFFLFVLKVFFFEIVDGNWLMWIEWKECFRICGGGFYLCFRICINFFFCYGGKECFGKFDEICLCNI